MSEGNFNNDIHALFSGMLVGHLLRQGVDATSVRDEDGDYTPSIDITLPAHPAFPSEGPLHLTVTVRDPKSPGWTGSSRS